MAGIFCGWEGDYMSSITSLVEYPAVGLLSWDEHPAIPTKLHLHRAWSCDVGFLIADIVATCISSVLFVLRDVSASRYQRLMRGKPFGLTLGTPSWEYSGHGWMSLPVRNGQSSRMTF